MEKFQNRILRVEEGLHGLMRWTLFLITGAMTGIVLLGVLFRYILRAPLPWSEELARYLMVWGASLGASVAYREGAHIAITILVDKFHGMTGRVITSITQIIVIVFMTIIVFKGFVLVFELSGQTSPAMEIPMAWPYLAIPVGCLFILFEAVITTFWKGQRMGKKGTEPL
ncbi:MAG: TRAP transporter small permease [Syntrophaceae bacterium]|nr:TRAP transporter small permease [Syntrophaceae bacterium]